MLIFKECGFGDRPAFDGQFVDWCVIPVGTKVLKGSVCKIRTIGKGFEAEVRCFIDRDKVTRILCPAVAFQISCLIDRHYDRIRFQWDKVTAEQISLVFLITDPDEIDLLSVEMITQHETYRDCSFAEAQLMNQKNILYYAACFRIILLIDVNQ